MKRAISCVRKNYKENLLAASFLMVLIFCAWMYGSDLKHSASPEISLASVSPAGEEKGAVIAASCGFNEAAFTYNPIGGSVSSSSNTAHGIGDTMCAGTCPAGSMPTDTCANGEMMIETIYTDANGNEFRVYSCSTQFGGDICPNQVYRTYGSFSVIPNGCAPKPNNVKVCTQTCANGTLPPQCTTCPTGKIMVNNQCVDGCPGGVTPTFTCGSGYILSGTTCTSQTPSCPADVLYGQGIYNATTGKCEKSFIGTIWEYIWGGTVNYNPTFATQAATMNCSQTTCTPGTGWNTTTNSCTTCATNQITQNNQCVTCPAGQVPDANKTSCIVSQCANGATNYPTCTCAANQTLVNGICTNVCTNGAINPGACNQCQTPQYYWNAISNSCLPNQCGNMIPPSNYGQTCGSGVNACGQTSNSGTVQCDGSCSSTANNNTCIQTFTPNTTSVYPNGSVEFYWKVLPGADGLKPTCGFYDRSKNNGVGLGTPIPGLQNLNPNTDRIRINNIQRNTEFCLVCIYAPVEGNPQAPAALHQWVRVIRVGEN